MSDTKLRFDKKWFVGAIFFFVFANVFAALEGQIEGAHGWGGGLPTVRFSPDNGFTPVWHVLMGGELGMDLYHILLNLLFLPMLFHMPFFVGLPWNAREEGRALARMVLLGAVWGPAWFLWNPHFGLHRMTPEIATWYPDWILGMPAQVVMAPIVAAALITLAHWKSVVAAVRERDAGHFRPVINEYALVAGAIVIYVPLFGVMTAVAAAVVPYRP